MVEDHSLDMTEEWPPSPQGSITHVPHQALVRIATEHQVPLTSLTTITVRSHVEPLYSAVLEYAALCDPIESRTSHPLSVTHVKIPRSNNGLSMDAIAAMAGFMSMEGSRNMLKGGRGLREKKVARPKFRLGLGETVIDWPPPPHLTAEYLNKKKRERRRRLGSLDATANTEEDNSEPAPSPPISDMAKENGQVTPNHDNTSRQRIHIVHYSVGEPQEVNGTLNTLCEVLIVGRDGSESLRNFAKEMCQWSIDKSAYDGDENMFSLYRYKTACGRGRWILEGLKRSRSPASVILPGKQMHSILEDVRHFLKLETRKWYFDHGVPHRRSFLFFGPPGTGKTSTIRVIGSEFRLNCCFLSMTTPNFSNQDLAEALSMIPENALLVLEDVDALFHKDRTNAEAPALSFSGFLNALDGLISADGIITIMTTNNISKLDSALIRGGRVDRRFHFPSPGEEQIKDLFLSFYPDAKDETADLFVRGVFARIGDQEARSIATLQQLFIDQRENSAEECAKSVASFFERFYPRGDTCLTGADQIYA